jgi:hypothetical protein
MKSKLMVTFAATLLIVLWQGCKDEPVGQGGISSTVAELTGKVLDVKNHLPLAGVDVQYSGQNIFEEIATSNDGSFKIDIELREQNIVSVPGTLTFKKSGYKDKSLDITAAAGKSTRVAGDVVYLERDTITTIGGGGILPGGTAHTFAFISASTREISVYGVGGLESSIITFEVRDSLGFPINIDHKDTVKFSLVGTPLKGGAYISPAFCITNASGRVATTVNSGTVSGVLQFVASLRREIDGVTIQSTPVKITVNAGLPDQTHFTVAPERYNFPGYDWLGREDLITAQVGDKYSNPVNLGTAVYFNTTGGIINASGFSNENGQATVPLHSGNPRPNDPIFGKGFAYVRAFTLGQNGAAVQDSILILFSGVAQISNVSIDSFDVRSHGSSGPILFTVSDENGNPLSQGTRIKVTLQYKPPPGTEYNFAVTGNVDVTLGDTRWKGPGTTDFSFQVVDQTIGTVPVSIPATVIIEVTSENGNPPPIQLSGHIGG